MLAFKLVSARFCARVAKSAFHVIGFVPALVARFAFVSPSIVCATALFADPDDPVDPEVVDVVVGVDIGIGIGICCCGKDGPVYCTTGCDGSRGGNCTTVAGFDIDMGLYMSGPV